MFNTLSKTAINIDYIEHSNCNHYFKCIYRGIFLHIKQNDLTYYSTGKNITGKISIKENTKKEKYKMKGEIK